MNIPGFTASASLGPTSAYYIGAIGSGGRTGETLVPAANCAGVTKSLCDAALATGILLFNPASWSYYKECCIGRPSENGLDPREDMCRSDPCGPGCPPDQRCFTSTQSGLLAEAEWNVLQADLSDIRRRLAIIARCACKATTPSITCGIPGAPCCAGDSCNFGMSCVNGFCQQTVTAPSITCGIPGAPCCAGDSCDSGVPCIDGFCQQIG
jgi:hypothetical protein